VWWFQADANLNASITVDEMKNFLQSKGKSNIAIYGMSTDDVRHVAKKSGGPGNGCKARSKLGDNIVISHVLNQLAGGPEFGNIVGGN
jgi:hypothetical protein